MQSSRQTSSPPFIGLSIVPERPERASEPTLERLGHLETARLVRHEINSRAARARLFRAALFSDPAWDILLDLFAAEFEGRRAHVRSVGGTARIPSTTALRWVNALAVEGLVQRSDDPLDRRRVFLRLTLEGRRLMTDYFERRLHLSIQPGVFSSKN